jgi:hypothetical protein
VNDVVIELGQPLPGLTVRIVVGASNTWEIALADLDGGPLDLTGVSLALELGEARFTATIAAGVATFTISSAAATKLLTGQNARLVLLDTNGERQVIAAGRSVSA